MGVLVLNCDPEHPCAEPRRLTYFAMKSLRASWLGARRRTPEKYPSKQNGVRNRGCVETKHLNRSEAKICTVVDISNAIGCANFGDDRLNGFVVAGAGGTNFPFPIDFRRHSYNALAHTVRLCDMKLLSTLEKTTNLGSNEWTSQPYSAIASSNDQSLLTLNKQAA